MYCLARLHPGTFPHPTLTAQGMFTPAKSGDRPSSSRKGKNLQVLFITLSRESGALLPLHFLLYNPRQTPVPLQGFGGVQQLSSVDTTIRGAWVCSSEKWLDSDVIFSSVHNNHRDYLFLPACHDYRELNSQQLLLKNGQGPSGIVPQHAPLQLIDRYQLSLQYQLPPNHQLLIFPLEGTLKGLQDPSRRAQQS